MTEKKFNETSLPKKEDFCSHLNMEDHTNVDYTHAKRVCKDFEIKDLGKYQANIIAIVDVFENFGIVYLEIYELDPARFLTAPGLV